MRPGRCKLVGFAVGVGWIVGATTFVRHADIRVARFLKDSTFEVCDYVSHRLVAYAECWRDLMTLASYLDNVWADLALLALAPVLLLWLAALVARKIWRSARASRI
jgi:hypothetical protein